MTPGKMSPLADDLEIWGFEDQAILFDDGSLGFGLHCCPLDIDCLSEDSTNDLKSKLCLFLNGLPSGIDLQWMAQVRLGNSEALAEHQALISDDASPSARELAMSRLKAIKAQDESGYVPKHDLYLWVRKQALAPLLHRKRLPHLLSSRKRYEAISEARLTRELLSLEQLQGTIIAALEQLGLRPKVLPTSEIMELLYDQWNPGRSTPLGTYDAEEVKQGLTFTDLGCLNRGFLMGDTQHRVLSLKVLPDQTFAGMAQALSELPLGARLFVTIHVPDQTKELASLQTQRRIAFAMARGKRSGVSDLESEAKLQDLETLLEQMIAQGERVFHMSLNVVLRSQDPERLDDEVNQSLAVIRSLSGAEAMEETLASYLIFRELALPNARARERGKRVKTSNLADLLPLYGPWEGMTTARVLLRTPAGGLLKVDPFDSELANANQLVSGGSGAGKSFMTNILIMHLLKENPRVYFVDIGGSYKKICENIGGVYVPLGLSSGLALNPFDLLPGETQPSPQKIKFLLGLIELMTKEEGEPALSRLERAEIESALQLIYKTHADPRLSDLRASLLAADTEEVRKIGKILSSWCGDSPFGQFVDRPTTINLTSRLVAFDLKGMESYPDLQAVCLFIITDLVWREVQKDKHTMKFLIFDECWKLLKTDAGLGFIEEVFRTFRKYRASAIAISQALDDFSKSKIAAAILPNCSMKWILMQPEVNAEQLSQVLNLNPREVALVKSLHQEKGRYSQVFLIAEKNRTVAVTEATPLEYWIATTDPRDLAVLDTLEHERPELSRLERLVKLAHDRPHGIAAFEKESR